MKTILQWAGRNGAAVVIAGVIIGLCIPLLSELARPYLAVAIFIFTFGSFLKFDGRPVRTEGAYVRQVALMVLWTTFGIPLIIALLIAVAHPGPELAQGLLFWALVPASPACVAFAAILQLNISIALLATVIGTALSPFYVPALAAAFGGYNLDIDPLTTCLHLVLLIGGAFLASLAAKRLANSFIRENPEAMTGIAVAAMFLAGMGSMRGMQAHLIAQPQTSLGFCTAGVSDAVFCRTRGYVPVLALRPERGPDRRLDQRNTHHHPGVGRAGHQGHAACGSVPGGQHGCQIHRTWSDKMVAYTHPRRGGWSGSRPAYAGQSDIQSVG